MNSSFVWAAFVLAALTLGWVGYHFSLRVVRVLTAVVALATVVYVTWYGITNSRGAAGSLSDAFARGADALGIALFHPLPVPPGHEIPGPGQTGWLVIIVLLVIGYRELEVWTLHWQARSLDCSALGDDRQDKAPGGGAMTDKQRHDRLVAELKFRLPAVQMRSPAIFPGGSRSSGLASIAEASGVTGSGLAGAIIRFFGMLWPSPRRAQVRVWVERSLSQADIDAGTRVTVGLADPRTGATIATKTLGAASPDESASIVAGYVAQHIFADDRTAPPWCTGVPDGRDLAALLLARQVRIYPETEQGVESARRTQIQILEEVAASSLCAGVVRYELAQFYDLVGRHVDALLLHAINRERYPSFYRGRYRLAMSLKMMANPDPGMKVDATQLPKLRMALKILYKCGVTKTDISKEIHVNGGLAELPRRVRSDLLHAAWAELRVIRRYLMLHNVLWRSFKKRDERGVLKPYWRRAHRQSFQDGICIALLDVAVRGVLNDQEGWTYRLPRTRRIKRIATAIAGDTSAIPKALRIPPGRMSGREAPPVHKSLRTRPRRWPWRCSTRSWQAAYNLACVYTSLAVRPEGRDQLRDLVDSVVTSLEFAICNPECEMERPWEWIAHDPDFGYLRCKHNKFSAEFRRFLDVQKERDYPPQDSGDGSFPCEHPDLLIGARSIG